MRERQSRALEIALGLSACPPHLASRCWRNRSRAGCSSAALFGPRDTTVVAAASWRDCGGAAGARPREGARREMLCARGYTYANVYGAVRARDCGGGRTSSCFRAYGHAGDRGRDRRVGRAGSAVCGIVLRRQTWAASLACASHADRAIVAASCRALCWRHVVTGAFIACADRDIAGDVAWRHHISASSLACIAALLNSWSRRASAFTSAALQALGVDLGAVLLRPASF